jgi:hypothetical protein
MSKRNNKTYSLEWLTVARKVTELEWADKVEKLEERIRGPVARMIWWDFFSGKLVGNRWSSLDRYIPGPRNQEEDWTAEELCNGLVACGYPRLEATRRSSDKKTFKKKAA